MLNEDTLEKLTEMMENMANRVIRGNMGVAADMLCWTPLAPWIRASRRTRIETQTHDSRLREKASARMQLESMQICSHLHGLSVTLS